GVLLDDLAEPRDRPVERAEQIVEVLRLDAWGYAIERCLRHALLQHFFDSERRNYFLDPRHRHLQFAVDPPLGVEGQRPRGHRAQVALLNPRPHDLNMAAGRLQLPEAFGPRFWRKIRQAGQLGIDVGVERLSEQRVHLLDVAAGYPQHGFDHGMILRRALGEAAVQFDTASARERRLHRSVDTLDRGIVEHDGSALGNIGQPAYAALADGPVHLQRRRLAAIGQRGRCLEFGDQQFRLVDL